MRDIPYLFKSKPPSCGKISGKKSGVRLRRKVQAHALHRAAYYETCCIRTTSVYSHTYGTAIKVPNEICRKVAVKQKINLLMEKAAACGTKQTHRCCMPCFLDGAAPYVLHT